MSRRFMNMTVENLFKAVVVWWWIGALGRLNFNGYMVPITSHPLSHIVLLFKAVEQKKY